MSDADLEKSDSQPDSANGGDVSPDQPTEATNPDVIPVTDVAALSVELQAANDRVLRGQAELENFRKRSRRELEDQRRYANGPLLGDLLPVLDNLDRALEAAEQAETDSGGLRDGVKMVAAQMLAVLAQHGCQPIEALGVAFDPNLHEAIGKEPSAEVPEGTITRVTRVGYQLHDRVVRPPQVLISSGQPVDNPEATPDV